MPQGLQIRDAAGNIVLDTSNRITRVVQQVPYTTYKNLGTGEYPETYVSIPGFVPGNGWAFTMTGTGRDVIAESGGIRVRSASFLTKPGSGMVVGSTGVFTIFRY